MSSTAIPRSGGPIIGGNPHAPVTLSPLKPSQVASSAGITSQKIDTNKAAGAHEAFLLLITQLIAVAGLAILADQGRGLRRAAMGIVVILWLVWLMNNYDATQKFFNKVVPHK